MHLSAEYVATIKQEIENLPDAQAEVWRFGSRVVNKHRGFTLVELVMTMIIVGILGAVVAPRFFDNNVFQSRGFADQVQATLRYAQKMAIAQRRFVCSTFSANSLTLTVGATAVCGTPLVSLNGAASTVITAPAGIVFTAVPTAFNFNALGAPSTGQVISITGATNTITIEVETGYVHSP